MSAFGFRPEFKLSLLIMVTLVVANVSVAHSETVVFEGGFSPDQWSWESNIEGDVFPVLEGTRSLSEPGAPLLPVQDLVLLIPADRMVSDAWVEPLATRTEKLSVSQALAPPHITDTGEMISTARLPNNGGIFPANWGEFSGTHTWRGYQLLTVSVYPARVENQTITYLDDYAVRVIYADGQSQRLTVQRERFVEGESEANKEILRSVLSNPQAVSGYARVNGAVVSEDKGVFQPTRSPSLSGSAVQYLIITDEIMKDEFQRLADYKTSLGMQALVVTHEYIAANFRNGADIQETIRMFIQDAYGKWGTEYVLLGGDTDILPPRYVDNTFYPATGSTEIPVDLYFACLDGNWNANGNAHFCEAPTNDTPGDEADFAEEVYLGRATVSSEEAARVFVDKVMTYEKAPQGSQWPNRILYACEVLFPADYDEGMHIILDGAQFSDQMVNELVEPCTDMEYVRMYETDSLYPREVPLNKSALIDSLNSGNFGIFNQIGHGYYFNMSVGNENFMNTDADALVNGDNLFVLFSLNCASAAFDFSCLMERFLQNPNGGSIISIGSSRAAFPNNSNNYQQGFFEALMCTPDNRAGKLIALSRLPYLGNTAYNYVDRWTFQNYTLMGDPTLPIWTGVPEPLSVEAPDMVLGPNHLEMVVSDGQMPVANAQVCLSRDGEDFATAMTDATGAATLDYLANSEGVVDLRITGVNAAQYQSTVEVLDGIAYLTLAILLTDDDNSNGTTGNGNTVIESGETIQFSPFLRETGGGAISGMSGVLSTSNPLVDILTGSVDFADLNGGGTTGPLAPITVSFDSGIVDGTPVTFALSLVDDDAEAYEIQWTTVVKAPELEVVLMDWEDSTYGNGDGFLGDDERVLLSVNMKNFGSGRADLADLRLRTLNPNVVLHDTTGTVSGLELMDSSGDVSTFSLSLSDASRQSVSYLVITDNYGRTHQHEFVLQRPQTPGNIVTDTSLGADVIALSWDPVGEDGLFGYNVFRSLSADGPFEQVNQDVVFGTSYFRNENLAQLTRYYYQVNSVGESLVPSVCSAVVEEATAPAEAAGFPVAFMNETSGSLAVGDVDGDGDFEIVLGSDELYVWHHDGNELIDGDNDSQTLGPVTHNNINASPAGITLAELDGIPGMEMIYCDRGTTELVHIIDQDGEELPGWPQTTTGGAGTQWVWASPAVGDIDGDGDLEIVVNSLNGRTWAWHHDGTEVRDGDDNPETNGVFMIRAGAQGEWGLSSPVLYDIDGDGARDIIFGTGNDDTGGNKVVAFKVDGTDVAGFPYFTDSRVNNSPAMGDLNNDGIMEIVFYDWGGYLYAVQQDGTDYPGFPVHYGFGITSGGMPSVALGDMDEDGELEIIFAGNVDGDLSKLVCVDTDISGGTSGTSMVGWPLELPGSSEGSPVVGDIDGDSVPDILFGIGGGSEDAPNNLYAFKASGTPIEGFPITLPMPLMPTPVICDLDQDMDVDIVYGGWDREVHVWDMPFAYDQSYCPWPTYQGNMQRDGVFNTTFLSPVEDASELPPATFKVEAPYPNPFNPSTSIRLHVPVVDGSSTLELDVYDLQGRKVRSLHNGPISAGWHTMIWDGQDNAGRNQSSGMYFMRARSAGQSTIHKMTLVK